MAFVPALPGVLRVAVSLLAFGGVAGSASAADMEADQMTRGLTIATENCSLCHAVGATGVSPRDGAPLFRALSARYPLNFLEEALAEGIMTGHNEMPEFVLEPGQIADLIAYLQSIQEPSGPAERAN